MAHRSGAPGDSAIVNISKMKKAELAEKVKSLSRRVEELESEIGEDRAGQHQSIERERQSFVKAVIHELRTPLTPVKSAVDMLYTGMVGSVTPNQEKFLRIIRRNIERLTRTIEEVEAIWMAKSAETELNPSRISVDAAIKDAVELLHGKALRKGVAVSLGKQTQLFVFADFHAVSRVVSHLVDNAITHNPENTTVTVSTSLSGRNSVQIEVADDGRGLPPEMLAVALDSSSQFDRSEGPGYAGAGLGLTVCRQLVEKMGGEISIDSGPGSGTLVSFTLPIRARRTAPSPS